MKRFFITLFLVLLVVWALRASHHPRHVPPSPPPMRWHGPPHPHHGPAGREFAEAQREAQRALAEAGRAVHEASHEVRKAFGEARKEIRHAFREVSEEVRQAYHEALAANDGPRPPVPPAPPVPPVSAREEVDGIPVPIVPGTRVTRAEAQPPVPAAPARLVSRAPKAGAPAAPVQVAEALEGQISATQQRATDDARRALQRKVVEWLNPEVPASWTPPAAMVQAMILETQVRPVVSPTLNEKDYGPLYVAEVRADFSPRRRADLVEAYTRELVQHRLVNLGGALTFVLICLGVISGYIRADEATKGYYTNRLRLLAAAGVGAAGVILYNMVA
jgi:hypothetical protein